MSRIGWWDPYVGPEIFINQRGSDGRSPNTYEMDLQGDYGLQLGQVTIHILASLFNVLNKQQVTQVDQVWANAQANNDLPYPDEFDIRAGPAVAAAPDAEDRGSSQFLMVSSVPDPS